MKRLGLFFFLTFLQLKAYADNIDIARQVFMNDEGVKAAIALALEQNYSVDEQIGTLYLSGSCGFAGCFETYMVSVGIHQNRVINPQSLSIIAKVTLLNAHEYKVKILDSVNL